MNFIVLDLYEWINYLLICTCTHNSFLESLQSTTKRGTTKYKQNHYCSYYIFHFVIHSGCYVEIHASNIFLQLKIVMRRKTGYKEDELQLIPNEVLLSIYFFEIFLK